MRPTDQHQPGSTRPNLLSGGRRRVADDDNILARLERDAARQALDNRSRAAWYAAAAVLVVGLVLFVAWMAYQNVNAPRRVQMTHAPVDLGPSDAMATIHAPTHVRAAQAPATIHDTPAHEAPPARDAAATGLPPLVLLQDARPALPPRMAPVVPTPAVRANAAAPAAVPERSRTMAPAAATIRIVPRPAARPRVHQPANDAVVAGAPVDSDVALLSAIIIHDSSHAAERAQMEAAAACARLGERRCQRKPTATP